MELNQPVVLVIDDEVIFLDLLESLLSDNYQVRTARSGVQALQKVLEEPMPDLILLDWVMPDIDGITVCQQLKQNPRTADIPVLFLTAKNDIDDEVRGFDAGAVDYIHKPLSPPQLMARVRTHIELKATREKIYLQKHQLQQLLEKRNEELRQARKLALNWFEIVMFNKEKGESTSSSYLDALKENFDSPSNADIKQLINIESHTPSKSESTEEIKSHVILQQLEKIITSKSFRPAKKMCSLLSFIVNETLAGNANTIKAFTIAVEVFQRDEKFDPQQDPLIRVQAGNLRKRLERYYLTEGKLDSIIIEIPKGGYWAVFSSSKASIY